MNKRGLAFKLALFILTSTAVIFLLAFGYSYIYLRNQILKDAEANAASLTMATVNKIESVLNGVEKVPAYISQSLTTQKLEAPALKEQMKNFISTNPEIYGSAVAFEPHAFDGKSFFFAPYVFRNNNRFETMQLGNDEFNYFNQDWYQVPRELGRAVWSEPYFDEGGSKITMATYSVPFYRYVNDKRVFTGVVTADIPLDWLFNIVIKLIPDQTGYAFIVSRNGVFIIHPNKEYVMRESIFSIAEAQNDPELRRMGRHMTRGGEGFAPLSRNFAGQKGWVYYAPLPSMGWSIGLVFSEEVLFSEITRLNQVIISIGAAGFAILFLVIIVISGTITRPLRNLAEKAREIAKGNLDIDVPPIKSADEVGELTESFSNMKSALKEYISNLAETTAAKERIESELKIAHTIQMSFLPKKFPPFAEKHEFDIYAVLEPAREVGGDLYDFFLLDDQNLFFSIGDVSGKGVPAALFMAVSKTLTKGIASGGDVTPSEIMGTVNAELCIDNESCMFVTMICGILNFKTGELSLANAGHNPPIFLPAGAEPDWLEVPLNMCLGIMEDISHQTMKMSLKPGDLLLLYTDGITEAMDKENRLFSNEALLETVRACDYATPEDLINCIMNAVRQFTGDNPPSDDMTVLAIRYRGPGK
ncbi:MAG: SpoIIE family protein phosphatase [Syntrophaceae bacterium]